MALSQVQCLSDDHVNPRTHESKPEFFYCEDQRLALEAFLRDGREAFGKYLCARGQRGFLSDPELETLADLAEPYDPGSELFFPEDAEDDEPPLSLHYWPELSDTSVPQMDLSWPHNVSYRGVTRTTVYAQPPLEGQVHIKEVVRKMIAQAQKVIAVVMDVFTDVDIFRDLLDAGFKRRVSVYILLERTTLPHFQSMCQRANMHAGHLKNLRVRCTDGADFYSRSCTKVRGRMGHRFMFIDGDKAVSGSYSFTWMSSRLDKNLITVVTGQAVEAFDRLFRILYASSSSVDLRQVTTGPEPELEPLPQPVPVAAPSAAMARRLYSPKYAMLALSSPSPVPSADPKETQSPLDSKNPETKKGRRSKEPVQEAPPLHPGLTDLEKVCMMSYLPTWPEPDPASDVIGFINIRDHTKTNQNHLQRSEMFETSQAIRFSSPFSMPKETLPEVAKLREVTAKHGATNKPQPAREETKAEESVVGGAQPAQLNAAPVKTSKAEATGQEPPASGPKCESDTTESLNAENKRRSNAPVDQGAPRQTGGEARPPSTSTPPLPESNAEREAGTRLAHTPQADAPQADAPQANAPQADASQAHATQADAPQADAPQANAPQADAPQANASQANASQANAPQADASQAHAPQAHSSQAHATQADAPQADAPQANAPQADAPQANASQANAPQADASQAHAPQAHSSQANASQANASQANASQANASQAHAPQADAPQAHAPQAHTPQAHAPQAHAPQAHTPQVDTPQADTPQAEAEPPCADSRSQAVHTQPRNSRETTPSARSPTANHTSSPSTSVSSLSENSHISATTSRTIGASSPSSSSSVPPLSSSSTTPNPPLTSSSASPSSTPTPTPSSTPTPTPPVPKPRTVQLVIKGVGAGEDQKLPEYSVFRKPETSTGVLGERALAAAAQTSPERNAPGTARKDADSTSEIGEAAQQKRSVTSRETKTGEADVQLAAGNKAESDVLIADAPKAGSVNIQEIIPTDVEPGPLMSAGCKLTPQIERAETKEMKDSTGRSSPAVPNEKRESASECKTYLARAHVPQRISYSELTPKDAHASDIEDSTKAPVSSSHASKHGAGRPSFTPNAARHNAHDDAFREQIPKAQASTHTPERPLRLQLSDTHVHDFRSPATPERESRSLSALARAPTPDGFPPRTRTRTPTPDSRTHTPDSRTPDFQTATPDGYISPRTDSEEYYECRDSPFHESVFDRAAFRFPGATEDYFGFKLANTPNTPNTPNTACAATLGVKDRRTSGSETESLSGPASVSSLSSIKGKMAEENVENGGEEDESANERTGPKGSSTGDLQPGKSSPERQRPDREALGPSGAERRDTDGQKLIQSPPKTLRGQQRDGEPSSPSRAFRPPRPLSITWALGPRSGAGRQPDQAESKALPGGFRSADGSPASPRGPPSGPPSPDGRQGGARAGPPRGQRPSPKPEASRSQAEEEELRQEEGKSPFSLTFSRLYSLTGLKGLKDKEFFSG